jgi:maltooligosyltrehalose synthase
LAITVIPRLIARFQPGPDWKHTTLRLPGAAGTLRNLFTNQTIAASPIPIEGLFAEFPVALLHA